MKFVKNFRKYRKPKKLQRLITAQEGRCITCFRGISLLDSKGRVRHMNSPARPSFDHVHCHARGGRRAGNLLVAHKKCNQKKSDRPPTGCELVWLEVVNARLQMVA